MHRFNKFNRFLTSLLLTGSTLYAINFEKEVELINCTQQSIFKEWDKILQNHPLQNKKNGETVTCLMSNGNKVSITQELAHYLLSMDKFGREQRRDQTHRGHHPTVRVENLFFKSDLVLPYLDPLMEMAAGYLQTLVFEKGIAPSTFFLLNNVQEDAFDSEKIYALEVVKQVIEGNEETCIKETTEVLCKPTYTSHLLQVSLAIDGENFKKFLSEVEGNKRDFSDLNTRSFGEHLIVSLILYPGDHKPENFILTKDGLLVGIDNDCIFHKTVLKKCKNAEDPYQEIPQVFAGCKNVFLLLTAPLEQVVDSAICQRILSIDPGQLVNEWLKLIQNNNEQIQRWLKNFPQLKELCKHHYFPLELKEGFVKHVLYKLKQLKEILLKRGENITYGELVKLMDVDLSNYYQHMLSTYKTYSKSLGKLYSNERPFKYYKNSQERVDPSVLKGRWLFDRLVCFKQQRNVSDNMDKYFNEHFKMKDLLMRNSDEKDLRERVANYFFDSFNQGTLPKQFFKEYPYTWIHQHMMFLKKTGINSNEIENTLKEFFISQRAYEVIVDAMFETELFKNLEKNVINLFNSAFEKESDNLSKNYYEY